MKKPLVLPRVELDDRIQQFFEGKDPEYMYRQCLEAGVVDRHSKTRDQDIYIPAEPKVLLEADTIPMAAMDQLVKACWGTTTRYQTKKKMRDLEEIGAVEDLENGEVEIIDGERFCDFLPPLGEWSAYQEIGEIGEEIGEPE